jgi:hypothetical protein
MFTKFVGIIPLKTFTAIGIYTALANFLKPYDLFHKIIFVCTDGAPVMRSTNEGLAGHVIKENPYVKSFHCIAHRFSIGRREFELTTQQSLEFCFGLLYIFVCEFQTGASSF